MFTFSVAHQIALCLSLCSMHFLHHKTLFKPGFYSILYPAVFFLSLLAFFFFGNFVGTLQLISTGYRSGKVHTQDT